MPWDRRHPCRQAGAGKDAGGPRKGRPRLEWYSYTQP